MTQFDTQALLDGIRPLARAAGKVIMEIYAQDFEVEFKGKNNPVTEADVKAEAVIWPGLEALTPDIPIIAEEAVAAGNVPDISGGTFWLVDPLDGTKEFVKKNDEFTVNIALIHDRKPVLGVVYAPALDVEYYGAEPGTAMMIEGEGEAKPISTRKVDEGGLVLVSSRSHGNSDALKDYFANRTVAELKIRGSSLKICEVACGGADYYPRFGPTCEWDIAAGHAVLQAAGGKVVQPDGSPFLYAKVEDKLLNGHFICCDMDAPVGFPAEAS
ncbi:MAG: 3'(2'),5'-bisphosphate nucleotidase CysQ [Alphaproteobacteria bacterium]